MQAIAATPTPTPTTNKKSKYSYTFPWIVNCDFIRHTFESHQIYLERKLRILLNVWLCIFDLFSMHSSALIQSNRMIFRMNWDVHKLERTYAATIVSVAESVLETYERFDCYRSFLFISWIRIHIAVVDVVVVVVCPYTFSSIEKWWVFQDFMKLLSK